MPVFHNNYSSKVLIPLLKNMVFKDVTLIKRHSSGNYVTLKKYCVRTKKVNSRNFVPWI